MKPALGARYARLSDGSTWRVMSVAADHVTLRGEDAAAQVWHVTLPDLAAKLRPLPERPS